MKTKVIFFFTLLLSGVILFLSCTKVVEQAEVLQINGGGRFLAINMSTLDTLKLSGPTLIKMSETLNARNDDRIKLKFEPQESYKNYHFDVTYILPDQKELKNPDNYEYVFDLSNYISKDYTIGLKATYNNDGEGMVASGGFILRIGK